MMAAAVAALVLSSAGLAQSARNTDPRLYPFLGCWRSDNSARASTRSGPLTCVVPVSGSSDVELLSVTDGRIVTRRRIDASARIHPIDVQGCSGQERTSWSSLLRRVYVRSEYVCSPSGITGGSTTLFSFLPTGEWLEVESVRSGSGMIVRAERRQDAGVPNDLPREIAGRIGAQRLAVMTARAEAAAPIRNPDIVEALRATDTAVVRRWLVETAQHFQLTGTEVAALIRDEVPASVLQAMMSTPPKYQLGVGVDDNGRSTEEYLNTPGWMPLSVVIKNAYTYGYPYSSWYYGRCCYPYRYAYPVYRSYTYYVPAPAYYPRETSPRPYYSSYSQSYPYYAPYYPYGGGVHYGNALSPAPAPAPRAPVGIRR